MRTPSRYLFRLPSHEITPFRATLFLILLICAALAGVSCLIISFVRTGNTFIFWLTLFIGYLIAAAKQEKIKLLKKYRIMADKRRVRSICQFAREFDTYTVDTWVIRAVWDTLQGNGYIDYPLPLKADDILDDDLDLVRDAVELEELVGDTAARCGRDLCGIEENPFLPIVTVGSLVRVLNAQPMTQERRNQFFIRS
ncbi:hypothetical protein DXT09_12470 [Escherichia coli]|uniref:hypothetical protein n=1 Tax=Escherichia coli TaxID=562 RepID=UPI0019E2867B|nr:hypothetical protein [Escherichia coli]EGO6714157.1 hypothetical protein [Escherichia coli]EGO9153215.1 hypothetical protein [Escherichia coli]EHB0492403.1 hypothetical protein [Escherichia coli]EJW0750078.1 hypothetical protein [Escherichia coli]EJZ1713589.1 hypothetical protein [Escherichia coli]